MATTTTTNTKIETAAPASKNAKQTNGEIEQAILRITDDYPRALVERDLPALSKIIADENVLFIESNGTQFNRAQYVERVQKADLDSIEYTNRQVRILSEQIALMTGRSVVAGRRSGGESYRQAYSVSNVLQQQPNGEWRIVEAAMTPQTVDQKMPVLNPVKYERQK